MGKQASIKKEIKKEEIQLTDQERQKIEQDRTVQENKNNFLKEYNDLVKKYKCGITVDVNSPIGNPSVKLVYIG